MTRKIFDTAAELEEDTHRSDANSIEEWCYARDLDPDEVTEWTTHMIEEASSRMQETGISIDQAFRIACLMSLHVGFETHARRHVASPGGGRMTRSARVCSGLLPRPKHLLSQGVGRSKLRAAAPYGNRRGGGSHPL